MFPSRSLSRFAHLDPTRERRVARARACFVIPRCALSMRCRVVCVLAFVLLVWCV